MSLILDEKVRESLSEEVTFKDLGDISDNCP